MIKLIKLSDPGWEKEFQNEEDARKELFQHICGICRKGDIIKDEETDEIIWYSEPVNEDSTFDEMLCSPCGCEFDVEIE